MLVLTRKAGESIVIGDDITIKVSDISGNRVKLCIDAPKLMRILRAEVLEQMESEVRTREPISKQSSLTRKQASVRVISAVK